MNFGWSPELAARYEELLAAVRAAFAGAARPPDGFYSRADWTCLGELGVLGLSVPAAFGGAALGALPTARLIEAFGRGCPDTGLVFGASAHLFACAMPIAEFGTDPVRKHLLPGMCSGELIGGNAMTEEGAGSDVSALAVTADEVPGGYRLNGTKSFVSNGPMSDVFVTYATTDPRAGHLGVTGFVVCRDAAGLVVGEPFSKMGLSSCPAGIVRFEDCFVPDDQVLGFPGQGGAIFQRSMGWERTCLFAGYLGLLDRVVEQCVAHATARRQFGHRIAEFQSVANRIVDIKLRTESARWLLYRACWEMDQGTPSALNVALAKLAVSEGAVACALDAIAVFGGRGYQRADGIEAVLRDTVPSTIFSGTSDIQRTIAARELGL